MKSRIDGLEAKGGGIYEDKKGRTYVGDRKKGVLYVIDRDSRSKLYLFQQRYTIPLIILLLAGFYYNWFAAIGLAILSLLILEFLYRRFLDTLTVYENVEIPESLTLKDRFESIGTGKLLLMLGICLLIGVLLVVNLLQMVTDWTTAFRDANTIFLLLTTAAMEGYVLYFLIQGIGVLIHRK
ncbi:MAG: hypothetical protein IKS51_03755 [Erysipelotrichaceae bacterium]|nr:hypothetical protein [Erysipelotrichaceae bacterium]